MDNLLTNRILAFFPPPQFLEMPAAGIDISDTSIKYIDAVHTRAGMVPRTVRKIDLEEGIVENGIVRNVDKLAQALKDFSYKDKRKYANVALPEELVYLYTIEVPTAHKHKEILQVIEFSLSDHAPIPAQNAVFNYDKVSIGPEITEISVTVFPKDVIDTYAQAFHNSGFKVKAFELESHTVARAAIPKKSKDISMVIDFGKTRTGITIAAGQTPVFSTTVKVGGDIFTQVIRENLKVDSDKIDAIKKNEGITDARNSVLKEKMLHAADELVEEIQKHYRYWNSRQSDEEGIIEPIKHIYLCGGAVVTKGLPEYVADTLNLPVKIADVWQNMFDIDKYIPDIHKDDSLSMATGAGLILRDM